MKAIFLIGLALLCGLRASIKAEVSDIPTLSPAQRAAVVAEANKAIHGYMLSKPEERDGENIPQKFWGETISGLKPLRVVNEKVNVKIVLIDNEQSEGGFYISVPISSYGIASGRFAEFVKLSQSEDNSFGAVYRYRLAKAKPKAP